MTGCLRTRVRKQPINALCFEFETVVIFYKLEARFSRDLAHHYGSTDLSDDENAELVSMVQYYTTCKCAL